MSNRQNCGMGSSIRGACACGFAAMLFAVIPATSIAQNWQVQPQLGIYAHYDDNIRLNEENNENTGQEGEVSGGVFTAGARIWRTSPTGSAIFNPFFRISRFGSDADSEDYYLDALLEHTGQKSNWILEARYSDEEVLSAELDDPDFHNPDIDNPINDDSGFVTVESRRDRVVIGPRVDFNLTQRTTLHLQGQIVDSGYESVAATFADYTDSYLGVGLSRALTEKNTFRLTVFGREYDPDIPGTSTESIGAIAAFERRFTERNSGYLHVGYESLDISQQSGPGVVTRSENAALFRAGLRRQFQVSRLVLDVQRRISPSGLAELRERNQFRILFERNLSPLMIFRIQGRYQETKSLTEIPTSADRDFARVRVELNRLLGRSWAIAGGYEYTAQKFADASGREVSNVFFLGFRYAPPRQQ